MVHWRGARYNPMYEEARHVTRTILVVDDDPAIRELVREFLDEADTEIVEAEVVSGGSGLLYEVDLVKDGKQYEILVNAFGSIIDPATGSVLAGPQLPNGEPGDTVAQLSVLSQGQFGGPGHEDLLPGRRRESVDRVG